MTGLLHFFIRLALLLLGFCVLWSLVTFVARMRMRKRRESGAGEDGRTEHTTGTKIIGAASKYATWVCLAMVFACGYAVRDLQTFYLSKPFSNVVIVQRHNDREFKLQPDDSQAFEVTMCDPQDWQPWEKMKSFDYEQKVGCKNLHGHLLGAVFYNDGQGKRLKLRPREEFSNGQ